jgi:predicted CXXCH cytochrome family protein
MEGHAFDDGAHGLERGRVNVPSSWIPGRSEVEGGAESGLPYAAAHEPLHCTSCHNVHDVRNRPFLQRETIAALCRECHPGRVNRGKVGIENTGSRDRRTSSHPTDVPVWDISGNGTTALVPVDHRLRVTTNSLEQRDRWVLGGKLADPTSADTAGTPFSCQTCHAVHGAADRPGEHYPGLLSIWEKGDPSALCLGCHSREHGKMAFAGGREVQHPVGKYRGTGFYPPRFTSPEGIPEEWTADRHFDGGAAPFDPKKREPPFCTSCHDVHGGLPGTSILFGPNPVDGGKGDWCYSCHPEEAFDGS